MESFNLAIIVMALNSLTLTLALGLFLLVLWLNPKRQPNIYYALLLLMVSLWTVGTLLGHAVALVSGPSPIVGFGVRLLQVGFVGASVSAYLFTAAMVGSRGRIFAALSIAGILMVLAYQAVLLLGQDSVPYTIDDGYLSYNNSALNVLVFVLFDGATLMLIGLQRRRINERGVMAGLLLFLAGQLVSQLNPSLRGLSVPVLFADVAVLLISISLVRQQVLAPLIGRANQLEAVRDVGLTISSRLRLDSVLLSISAQVASLLDADAVAIFQLRANCLEVVAVHNMPLQFVGHQLPEGQGMAGMVVRSKRAMRVDDYAFDWHGQPDLPLAKSTFGSVVVAPLIFGERIQGILFVIQGRQGKIFGQEHVRLLELLGPQAAVAIANGSLFEQQKRLTDALELAKNQLETVLTSTRNPVIAVDRAFQVIFLNPAAAELLSQDETTRISTEDLRDFSLTSLVPATTLPSDARSALRSLRRRRAFVYEVDFRDRSYLCHVAPLGAARTIGWVAVLNDVTELKEMDRFKSQMVRLTSHDLKNPLFAAMSYVDLLDEELEEGGRQDLRSYVSITMQQLERMNRTIRSILDLERVQAGVMAIEACDLSSIVEQVVDELSPMAEQSQLTLEVRLQPSLPCVNGDQRQLSQVVANLLENAIKYTAAGGRVVTSLAKSQGGLLVTVTDTGIGIPQEVQSRVFERFYRVQQPGFEHVSGSGLGLSLVRDIVVAHHGRVWLESQPGIGTSAYVWLPIPQEEVS